MPTAERSGYTLVELLITIILSALVMAAMISVLVHQQRFYLRANDVAEVEGSLDRTSVRLAPELLPLNPAAGDLVSTGPDSLVARVFRGVYRVCAKRKSTDVFITLRAFTSGTPVQADSGFVYGRGTSPSLADDGWHPVRIANVNAEACPDSSAGWTVTVQGLGGVLSEVPIGAPVRLFRHGSYWLASDGRDYLLMTDALGGDRTTVSGPLLPVDSAPAAALRFTYLDENGDPAATTVDVAQIRIDASALGEVPGRRDGVPHRAERSLAIKLRNVP